MAIDFGDLASRYMNARIDSATQPFNDPEAYLNNRLQQNYGVDMNGNVQSKTTTITQNNDGTSTVTQKQELGAQPEATSGISNLNFAAPQAPGGMGLQMPQAAPTQQPMFNVGGAAPVTEQPQTPQAVAQPQAMPQVQQEAQLPQQLAQTAQAAPQPQVQAAPEQVPNIGQVPTPGPATQLAGPMVPGVVQNAPTTTPQPNEVPATTPVPAWHGQLEKSANDFAGLTGIIADASTPADIKDEAKDRLWNLMKTEKLQTAAQKTIAKADSGDKKSINDLAREMSSEKAEGSWVKAILFSRLGLTQLAADEQQKLGGGAKYSSYMDASGNHYTVKLGGNGAVEKAYDQTGARVDEDTLANLNANYLSMKGAATGQTMGFDKNGNVISHTVVPGTGRVIWKDETSGKILANAPEGYHTGKNQQEMLANNAFAQTRKKLSDANAKEVAAGRRAIYTDDQIEAQANAARASILGLPSTTYGGGGEGGVTVAGNENAVQLATRLGLPVISGVRDQSKQQQLWDESVAAGRTGFTATGNPIARPGTSAHQNAMAVDMHLTPEQERIARANGFTNPVSGDPNHWELRPTAAPATRPGAGNPSITEVQQSNARAIANYEAPPLKGGGMNSQNATIMALVREMNPGYDTTRYDAMAKARKDFTTGKQGDTVRSMNVAIDHLDSLQEAANALKNGNVRLFNAIGNEYGKQTGQSAPTSFDGMKTIVGAEVAKAIQGGATALGDREEIRSEISNASSPQQLAGLIAKYQKLMGGQLKGLRTQYEEAGLKDFDNKLEKRTKKVLGSDENTNSRSNW